MAGLRIMGMNVKTKPAKVNIVRRPASNSLRSEAEPKRKGANETLRGGKMTRGK